MYTLGLRRVRCGISEPLLSPKAGGLAGAVQRHSGWPAASAAGRARGRPAAAPATARAPARQEQDPNKAKNKKTEEATASAYGAGPEGTSSKTKGTATSPHSGPALVGSQYFDLWHLKNVKTKFRKKI